MFTRLLLFLVLSVGLAVGAAAQGHTQQPSTVKAFFQSIVGDWIGTCEQSTDGEKADNKYFHASIKQSGPDTFASKFDYYRLDDATGKPLHIGDTTVVTTINPNGTAKNKVTGQGTMLVNMKPKNQQHVLNESISSAGPGTLQGTGSGSISVNGMPLGLGKNGKISDDKSTWMLKNDTLTISQSIKAAFSALIFTKSFRVAANYTAKRGTDVSNLMIRQTQASTQTY